jgi:hypothetical protein
LFDVPLERTLKAAFIFDSGSSTDNPGMLSVPASPGAPRRHPGRLPWRAAMVALLLCTMALPASWASSKDDHELARAAVQAGEVLPLPAVLERLQRTHPGQVLELELERHHGRWTYEVKLLQPGGQLLRVVVDARTAQVLETRRK